MSRSRSGPDDVPVWCEFLSFFFPVFHFFCFCLVFLFFFSFHCLSFVSALKHFNVVVNCEPYKVVFSEVKTEVNLSKSSDPPHRARGGRMNLNVRVECRPYRPLTPSPCTVCVGPYWVEEWSPVHGLWSFVLNCPASRLWRNLSRTQGSGPRIK